MSILLDDCLDEWQSPKPDLGPWSLVTIIGQLGFHFDGETLRVALLCHNAKLSRTKRAAL